MNTHGFEIGELVICQIGSRYEIGKIKSFTEVGLVPLWRYGSNDALGKSSQNRKCGIHLKN